MPFAALCVKLCVCLSVLLSASALRNVDALELLIWTPAALFDTRSAARQLRPGARRLLDEAAALGTRCAASAAPWPLPDGVVDAGLSRVVDGEHAWLGSVGCAPAHVLGAVGDLGDLPEVDLDDCLNSLKATLEFVFNDYQQKNGFGAVTTERLDETWKVVADAQELDPKWNPAQAIGTRFLAAK